MSRRFVSASSQILSIGSTPITAAPLTLAGWAMPIADTQITICQISNGGTSNFFQLFASPSSGVAAVARASSSSTDSSWNAPLNVWTHCAAVFASSTNRRAFTNALNLGVSTTSRVPSGLTTIQVGRGGSSSLYGTGLIALPAIWNAALTDAEVLMLAQGTHPTLIRPKNLVAFWPLNTPGQSVEYEWKRRFDLTVTGATPATDGPPVWQPSRRRIFIPSLSVSGGNRRRRSIICGASV